MAVKSKPFGVGVGKRGLIQVMLVFMAVVHCYPSEGPEPAGIKEYLSGEPTSYDVILHVVGRAEGGGKKMDRWIRVAHRRGEYLMMEGDALEDVKGEIGSEEFYVLAPRVQVHGYFDDKIYGLAVKEGSEPELKVVFNAEGMNKLRAGEPFLPRAVSGARWIETFGLIVSRDLIEWVGDREFRGKSISRAGGAVEAKGYVDSSEGEPEVGLIRDLRGKEIETVATVKQWIEADGERFPGEYEFVETFAGEAVEGGEVEVVQARAKPIQRDRLGYRNFYIAENGSVTEVARTEGGEVTVLSRNGAQIRSLGEFLHGGWTVERVVMMLVLVGLGGLLGFIVIYRLGKAGSHPGGDV